MLLKTCSDSSASFCSRKKSAQSRKKPGEAPYGGAVLHVDGPAFGLVLGRPQFLQVRRIGIPRLDDDPGLTAQVVDVLFLHVFAFHGDLV